MDKYPCSDCVFSRGEDGFGWCLLKDERIDLDQTGMDCHREDVRYRLSPGYNLGYIEGHAAALSEVIGQ